MYSARIYKIRSFDESRNNINLQRALIQLKRAIIQLKRAIIELIIYLRIIGDIFNYLSLYVNLANRDVNLTCFNKSETYMSLIKLNFKMVPIFYQQLNWFTRYSSNEES
jgi:hypothetical protein